MNPTIRRDDELAQQAPLVPDIGRGDEPRTDGGRTTPETPPMRRAAPTDAATRRADDDEQARAPLVPNLGSPDGPRTDDATTDTR